ncbi:hypothetical protein JW872_01450 [Candidatus Babeliales bacterium]|nr:hypothetical protein [Candidatus Babeliales bacterium]
MKAVRSAVILGMVVLAVMWSFARKSTPVPAVVLFSFDEFLSRSEQDKLIIYCADHIRSKGLVGLQAVKDVFASLADISARRASSKAFTVHVTSAQPRLFVNNTYVLAQGPVLLPCSVYAQTTLEQLPKMTVAHDEFRRTTLPRDMESFIVNNGSDMLHQFDVTWLSPTSIIAYNRDARDFAILCGQETVPNREGIATCRSIYTQLKPKLQQCVCADVRFDNQIIAFYEKKDLLQQEPCSDMIIRKGIR